MSSPTSTPPSSSTPKFKSTMSEEERSLHLNFMREALAMAELALASNETPVGCVFVHNNVVIGRGMNDTNRSYNGTRHAEFMALSAILSEPCPASTGPEATTTGIEGRGKRYSPELLRECDLYVTVEPCIMCASLLRQVGVRKVYYGASNEKFGGTGGVLDIHLANGRDFGEGKGQWSEEEDGERKEEEGEEGDYEVSGGWLREEAIVMLRRFYVQENERAPEPRAKKERILKLEVEPEVEGKTIGNG